MLAALQSRSQAAVVAGEPFAVLAENHFAYTAAMRLVEPAMPPAGSGPRITVLFGPQGSGKTHLCRHATRELLKRNHRLRFLFLRATDFTQYLLQSRETATLTEAADELANFDLLVLDQFDDLQDHADEQQVLISLLDALADSGTQVLIASEKSPGELRGMQSRLVNRCHGGLCAGLRLPEAPSRRILVEQFAHQLHMALPGEVAEEIALRAVGSPAYILQVMRQLEAQRRRGQILNRAFVKKYLLGQTAPARPQLESISHVVAEEFGVTLDGLRSQSRHASLVLPRQLAMLLARELTELTLAEIGRYFGDRNHTTVSHGCEKIESLLPTTPTLRQQIQKIRGRITELPQSETA